MLGFWYVTRKQCDMNINVHLFCTGTDLKNFKLSTGHKTSGNNKCPIFISKFSIKLLNNKNY